EESTGQEEPDREETHPRILHRATIARRRRADALRSPGPFAYHPSRERSKEDPMPLSELNHYFVRANDLESTKQFYCDVLGFEIMPRPTFPFPGYWLGVNGKIQVHMGPHGIDNADMYYLGTPKDAVTDHAGVVDHIAFLASEPGGFIR